MLEIVRHRGGRGFGHRRGPRRFYGGYPPVYPEYFEPVVVEVERSPAPPMPWRVMVVTAAGKVFSFYGASATAALANAKASREARAARKTQIQRWTGHNWQNA